MPLIRSLCILLLACLALSACERNTQLINVLEAPTQAKTGTGLDSITEAIMTAGNQRGWQKTFVSPGLIRAKLITGEGKHVVDVNIRYTEEDFSIIYADSMNMNFQIRDDGEKRIHPKYNEWVETLKFDIQQSIKSIP